MARPKALLGEIMGAVSEKGQQNSLTLKDLPDILGETMPELPKNQVGRFRLIRSLKRRFGDSYRNLPGIKNLISEFDDEISFESDLNKLRKVESGKTK